MSLRDTIEGARSEASLPSSKSESESTTARKGAGRGSAANAKPSREKAASVRTVSASSKKAASTMASMPGAKKTKEQKEAERAERRKQREEEDYKNQAFQLLLNKSSEYKKSERTWWVLLGIGFIATVFSLVSTFLFPVEDGDYTSMRGVVSIAFLALAYVFIIASFVYDWRKRRPIRKEVEAKMAGMSNRKIAALFAEERKAELERNATKEAARAERAARRAGKKDAASEAGEQKE